MRKTNERQKGCKGCKLLTTIYIRGIPLQIYSRLPDLEGRKVPKTNQQATDNIEATITMGSLLKRIKLIEDLETRHSAMLEARCIMQGTRRDLYDNKQVKNMISMAMADWQNP